MTWLRKVQAVVMVAVVLSLLALPLDNWVEGFIGLTS
jgi:hypothetical protein